MAPAIRCHNICAGLWSYRRGKSRSNPHERRQHTFFRQILPIDVAVVEDERRRQRYHVLVLSPFDAEFMSGLPAPHSPHRTLRVDAQHHLQQLMQRSVQRISNAQVKISVCSEHVRLEGHVTSWAKKQLAQETVRSYSGERVIVNALQVRR